MNNYDGEYEFVTPFGPTIMMHQCPQDILKKINDYVYFAETNKSVHFTTSSLSKNVPDLLHRGLENIFLYHDYCVESGIADYVEELSEIYCDTLYIDGKYKLSILDKTERDDFPFCKDIKYADCWVNKYKKGDYTPLHKHGAEISGIIFLKIPDEIKEASKNHNYGGNMGGVLHFSHTFDIVGNISTYVPEHEDGLVFLFPSWLQHLVYPHTCDDERRTFSFNLIKEQDFDFRNNQFK